MNKASNLRTFSGLRSKPRPASDNITYVYKWNSLHVRDLRGRLGKNDKNKRRNVSFCHVTSLLHATALPGNKQSPGSIDRLPHYTLSGAWQLEFPWRN